MSKNIAFNPEDQNPDNDKNPWSEPKRSSYNDQILRPEYEARRLRFGNGQTWFRIVPGLAASEYDWLLPLHIINYNGGRFAHPKTLRMGHKSVFDAAYGWMRERQPGDLFSKQNKSGARLLTDPMGVFWAIVEEDGKRVARLVVASGYDGSRGGSPGLGYQIWRKVREKDENDNVTTDAIAANAGLLVCVEKTQARGAKYPNYTLRLGRQPCPIDAYLENVDPEEVAALCPLERVVHEPSEEEQWNCLEKVISPDLVSQIRTDLRKAA